MALDLSVLSTIVFHSLSGRGSAESAEVLLDWDAGAKATAGAAMVKARAAIEDFIFFLRVISVVVSRIFVVGSGVGLRLRFSLRWYLSKYSSQSSADTEGFRVYRTINQKSEIHNYFGRILDYLNVRFTSMSV